MKKDKIISTLLSITIITMLGTYIYNTLNNKKIEVIYQDVKIDNLPSEFEQFKILQISDLHGASFGQNQQTLVDKINSLDYDILAITGDMKDVHSDNNVAFLEVLDNINKKPTFYVEGNSDLINIQELEPRGVKILKDTPYVIKRGKSSLYIGNMWDHVSKGSTSNFMLDGIKESDTLIGLSHYPMNQNYYENSDKYNLPPYDLILSGHYHGGQWRVPFYGALYIPDVEGDTFLPKQNVVSGLNEWGNHKQYVSRGLGASSPIKFLQFRLFNTPQIDLITLNK